MIVRIFRVRVPAHLQGAFEEKFLSVSVPAVERQAGFVSVTVGKPTRWSPDEYMMISTWESESALESFAGKDWNRAVIPDGMAQYVLECRVHHYEVFGDPEHRAGAAGKQDSM